MRLIVDANIVVSSILGHRDRIRQAVAAGLTLLIPETQMEEAARVLINKIKMPVNEATNILEATTVGVAVVEMAGLEPARDAALDRLEPRGRPDWPVLAAAMLLDADIWSDDRDFFGVGVAVWSRNTIAIAIREAAAA